MDTKLIISTNLLKTSPLHFLIFLLICIVFYFPSQYSTEGKLKELNLAAEADRDIFLLPHVRDDMGGVLLSAMVW